MEREKDSLRSEGTRGHSTGGWKRERMMNDLAREADLAESGERFRE